jgi:hypothetical protein
MARSKKVFSAQRSVASRRRRARDRRGVLILVVLTLLILFVVVAVMFVMVATRARAVSGFYSEFDRTGDSPQAMIHNVALDLIRGSLNPHSPLRSTSLLEDIYGHYSLRGQATAKAALAGGIMDIEVNYLSGPQGVGGFSPVKDAYSGCVLTFINGDAKNVSARILEYWPTDSRTSSPNRIPVFRIMLIPDESGRDQSSWVNPTQSNPTLVVINGRPFSGTGVGYNVDSSSNTFGRLTATEPAANAAAGTTGLPYALLPNAAFFVPNGPTYNDPAGPGGANEDYDAPDFQNPFLAFYDSPSPTDWRQIKPSFHDPALTEFWYPQMQQDQTGATARKVVFRPHLIDHPRFPAMDLRIGPWDIDNDGDGVVDSVWIDPGYPVQMTRQGRAYKTLAAVLVLDLDGRLNLNAHGMLQTYGATQFPSAATTAPRPSTLAGGQPFPNPPRGLGVGPAEIRLDAVLGSSVTNNILYGSGNFPGRYGPSGDGPGQVDVHDPFSAVKLFAYPPPADTWPGAAGSNGGISAFGSPPDLKGQLAVALDPTGQPVWDKPAPVWTSERLDNPYEINLSRYSSRGLPTNMGTGPYDSSFTPSELERLLRAPDIDSTTLPSRLLELVKPLYTGPNARPYLRNEVTVDSWDPPVPNMLPAPHMRGWFASGQSAPDRRMTSLVELVQARLSQLPTGQQSLTPAQMATAIESLVAPELRRGLRMDINRPFGDGLDTASAGGQQNGIVDEAYEVGETLNYQALTGQNQPVPFDPVNADLNRDGQQTSADRYAYDSRQLLARHLYVLMMLCTDDNFQFRQSLIPAAPAMPPQTPKWGEPAETLAPQQQQELKARKLAQWAINVVDFRDPDNIMSPFEYDTNPFNGWNVDGRIGSGSPDDNSAERGLVWGCEMPVAILTETLAFHDRRVKDTDHDESDKKRDDMNDGQEDDPTLDQTVVPRGSAFVEIMAIFQPNVGVQSWDLFEFDGSDWYLDLGKMAPAGPGGAKPVWRLAVTKFHHADTDDEKVGQILSEAPDTTSLQPQVPNDEPSNFSLLKQPGQNHVHNVDIERVVWFGNTPPTAPADIDRTYYATTSANVARLKGFQYAVIGPGGRGGGDRTNATLGGIPVGWRTDGNIAQTQQIRLEPNFDVTNDDPGNYNATAGQNIQNVVGIPVASPAGQVETSDSEKPWGPEDRVGFSISEPLFSDDEHYYPKPSDVNPATNLQEAYGDEADDNKKFIDQPLDSADGMPLKDRDMLATGTYMNVRTVFLQRLADPTRPFHPATNPYITVDWMPMDLTVFNGEDRRPDDAMINDWDPDDPDGNEQPVHFTTRQRGKVSTFAGANQNPPAGANTDSNIWAPISEEPEKTDADIANSQAYFAHRLKHTLGYLNKSYGQPLQPPPSPYYLGGPGKPFPWIRWANRPFANALELMEVPASTPSRLLMEFSYIDQNSNNPYDVSVPNPDPAAATRPFRHLLNFFGSSDRRGRNIGGEFYRLFEFVHVPSPFVGTETMLDPQTFNTPTSGNAQAGTENFRAPFNWVSNYRDPGKINLNTINSPGVFTALLGLAPGQNGRVAWDDFVGSRRGGVNLAQNEYATTPIQTGGSFLPTIMPNPFRSGSGGDMVPDLPGNASALGRIGVNLTLLRASADGSTIMFANPAADPNGRQPYADNNRNAHFRYQSLERLSNLTTTRSNVYAVWITIGYFEVFPNTRGQSGVDPGHPDGYELGPELGTDTGEITRHRGFYIIDRSIPVAFERGYNHNVDRAILVKRFIE